MAADISALGQLQPIEPLDLEAYVDNQEAAPLPKKGVYTVRAPESFSSASFGRTKKGALSASIDPVIVGPTNEGYTLRFTKVSAQPFKRNGVTVSQMGDYLRACGKRQKIADEQQYADAIEETANQVFEVELDWSAYNKESSRRFDGMETFPSDGNGGHQPWIEDKDSMGNPVRLRANAVVTRYIAQK